MCGFVRRVYDSSALVVIGRCLGKPIAGLGLADVARILGAVTRGLGRRRSNPGTTCSPGSSGSSRGSRCTTRNISRGSKRGSNATPNSSGSNSIRTQATGAIRRGRDTGPERQGHGVKWLQCERRAIQLRRQAASPTQIQCSAPALSAVALTLALPRPRRVIGAGGTR